MAKYIIKRLAQAIPLLILISILCFTLLKLAPYDAIDAITTPNMSQRTIALIKAKYGLDRPAYLQYFYWISGIVRGEFGYSLVTHESIAEALLARIPATVLLVLPAYAAALILTVILGLYSGFQQGKWLHKFVDGCCSIGIATPSFWLAMILVFIFGYKLKWFPIIGMHTIGAEHSLLDLVRHLVMPFTVLTIAFLPELIQYVKSSTISQLSEDYVVVQKAFGAGNVEILFRHVFKNVLLPVITMIGMALPMLVTGAFITETVFSWPGIGPYFVKAIQGMDYPVVMAIMLLSAGRVIIGNLAADLLYSIIDPRIQSIQVQRIGG